LLDTSWAYARAAPRRAAACAIRRRGAGQPNQLVGDPSHPSGCNQVERLDQRLSAAQRRDGDALRRPGQARTLSRADEVVPGLHERPAHLRDRSPLARSVRHLVGQQRPRFRSGPHGAGYRRGFVRRVARTPHYDGVKKDGKEPAVIGRFGIAPVRFELQVGVSSDPQRVADLPGAATVADLAVAPADTIRARAIAPVAGRCAQPRRGPRARPVPGRGRRRSPPGPAPDRDAARR
jgi:hypothetical protein